VLIMLVASSAVPWYQQPFVLILGVVAGVITFLGFIFQMYQWWAGRERLLLAYEVLSSEYLVSIKEAEELRDRLSITFDHQPAQGLDIRTYLVELRNVGTRDVSDTRFRSDVEFRFGDCCEVLTDGDVRDTPDLAVVVLARDNTRTKLVLKPLLLKKGERILVRALVKSGDRCEVMARLDDVGLINWHDLSKRWSRNDSLISTGALIGTAVIAVSFSLWVNPLQKNTSIVPSTAFFLILVFVGLLIPSIPSIMRRRHQRFRGNKP